MGKIGLLVNYDGHWDGAQFLGSSPFGVCVSTEEKHDQLLEKIYRRVGVNRDRFKLKLSTMVNTKTGKKILPILCDGDVEFVLVNTECTPEVFVEVVERPVAALETVHVHQTPIEAIPMHPTSFSKDAEDKAGGGTGKEAVGNPKPDADKTTFWTNCPSCGIRYQYHRTHVNTLLLCQSCQQSFTAYDLGSLEISSAHPCNRSLNQNGVPNPVFQNRFPNPGPSKVPSQSNHGNCSAMAQEKVDGHMKGMEGVRMHKPDVENRKVGVGKPKPDGGKPSECGTSRNADKKRKRMPVGESSENYEAGNGDEDEDVVLAAQAHLYTVIKVAQDKDLAEQIGRDIYFDLVDHDKVRSFRIQKQTPFISFKEKVAKEFGIPVQFQRFWIWGKRQNHTYRPNRPLLPQEEAQTVGQLREVNKTHNAELKLFLEVEIGPDLRPIPPPDKSKEDILLFFKLYDPEKAELRYVGRLFLKSYSKPITIIGKLNQMAGFDPDEEIELYEEIKFEPCVMCEHLEKRASFRISQIEDGDIICFQKISPLESEEDCRYPDVPSFLEYVRSDNAPKRAYSVNQNRHTFEKPVKIYN